MPRWSLHCSLRRATKASHRAPPATAIERRNRKNCALNVPQHQVPFSGLPKKVATCRHFRVSDGTRTRDRWDHNPELYQLSYAHHARTEFSGGCAEQLGSRVPTPPQALRSSTPPAESPLQLSTDSSAARASASPSRRAPPSPCDAITTTSPERSREATARSASARQSLAA
jgi:hypothetical protein